MRLDNLCSIVRPVPATLLLLDNAPPDFKIGVHLNEIDAAGNRIASRDNQFANVVEEVQGQFHSSPRIVPSTSALSASSAAISSMIACGLRCAITSLEFKT